MFLGSLHCFLFAFGNMASGVAVSDGLIKVFSDMKVQVICTRGGEKARR